jgi:hypothetical protein
MIDEITPPVRTHVAAILQVEAASGKSQSLGAAVLLAPEVALVVPRVAEQLLRTGIEDQSNQYWLVAGAIGSSTPDLFRAPVRRLRIAEEPDPDGFHHVAVVLDTQGWLLPSGPGGTDDPDGGLTEAPCGRADAAVIAELVANAPVPDSDWLAMAMRTRPGLVQPQGSRDAGRTFPPALLAMPDQRIWPLWPRHR